jgi:hypothetical protein
MIAVVLFLNLFAPQNSLPQSRALDDLRTVTGYDCSHATCKQIGSCEEACYKLLVCGHHKRDADNDGIPCENLCSKRCDR